MRSLSSNARVQSISAVLGGTPRTSPPARRICNPARPARLPLYPAFIYGYEDPIYRR